MTRAMDRPARKLYLFSAKGSRGFTLIEVITILVIMGILSAVVISRMGSTSTYSLASEVDILKTHLRYVQYRAMSDSVTWGMSFTGGSNSSYSLRVDKAATTSSLPNENSSTPWTHNLPPGITITTEDGAGTAIDFNEWGNPVDGSDKLLTSDYLISLSDSSSTQTVRITQNTGFIP